MKERARLVLIHVVGPLVLVALSLAISVVVGRAVAGL